MESENIIINGAEDKEQQNKFDPGIIHRSERDCTFMETWAPYISDHLFDQGHEYIYIRKVNDHIEIGPAHIEHVQ